MKDAYVEFLQRRDRASYTRFVTAYLDSMLRVARRVVGCHAHADDVVQTAFLRLADATSSENTLRSPRAYVLRTVVNVARNQLRADIVRTYHESKAAHQRSQTQSPTPSEIERQELAVSVHKAIDQLPPEHRLVVHLRYLEGLSYREIADVSDVNVKTVASRLHRARLELRRRLGGVALSAIVVTAAQSSLTASPRHLETLARQTTEAAFGAAAGATRRALTARTIFGWTARTRAPVLCTAGLLVLVTLRTDTPKRATAVDTVTESRHLSQSRPTPTPSGSSAGEPTHGRELMDRRQRLATALILTTTAVAATPQTAHCDPGDLIGLLPAALRGPIDMARDTERNSFWVTSASEYEIVEYSSDLKERVGAIRVPFLNPILSYSGGIAYNSLEKTLLVADFLNGRIHEVGTDGVPTGLSFQVEAARLADGSIQVINGLAFDPNGDDGRGSLYVALRTDAVIQEFNLAGTVLRSFPDVDDPQRFGGLSKIDLTDMEPIIDEDRLTGFYVTATVERDRHVLLRVDRDGTPTGVSVPLGEAGGEVGGIHRLPFPHPDTGETIDAYVGVVSTGPRFAVFAGGEPRFLPPSNLRCSRNGRRVSLSWSSPQDYEFIDVLDQCGVLATLPGDVTNWSQELGTDGIHHFTIRATHGANQSQTSSCAVVLGPGELVRYAPHELTNPRTLATDGESAFVVASEWNGSRYRESIYRIDADLQVVERIPISEFFLAETDLVGAIAWGGTPGSVYVYNRSQNTVALVDRSGLILSFPARLPDVEIDPPEPNVTTRAIESMALNPGGNDGQSSLWLFDRTTDELFEIDLAGNVLRQLANPVQSLGLPYPPIETRAMTFRPGETAELYLHVRFAQEEFLLRADSVTGEVLPGSEMPLREVTQRDEFTTGISVVRGHDSQLFVLGTQNLYVIDSAETSLRPPEFLSCRQISLANDVELTFQIGDTYDGIEVYRDCERIAELNGDVGIYVDRDAPAGIRTYDVRGVRGGVATDAARRDVRVGMGATLFRELAPAIPSGSSQITRDPTDGSFYLTKGTATRFAFNPGPLYHFDEDLNLVETTWPATPADWDIHALAIRIGDDDEREFHYLAKPPSEAYHLVRENRFGEILLQAPITASFPTALTWDPVSDSFFFYNRGNETIVRLDSEGRQLASFPHPNPPLRIGVDDFAMTLAPARRSLLIFAAEPTESKVSKLVELDFQGRLTGYEIPLPWGFGVGYEQLRAAALAGPDLVAVYVGQILRIKAFEEDPMAVGPATFVRGDTNRDSEINLSDPLHLLNHLFLGGARPPCRDAADSDDDGALNLADAVYVLNFLFLGGEPPQPPFPQAGTDPTADALPCRAEP